MINFISLDNDLGWPSDGMPRRESGTVQLLRVPWSA